MIHAVGFAAILAATNPVQPAESQGKINYPASFFLETRPTTAMDMLSRLPGFSLEKGDRVRGFEGGGGNVLINGERPVSKTDDLDEILRRIPASRVASIELIRGGAAGIDMQGRTVLSNVILAKSSGFQGVFAVANNYIYDGRDRFGVRLEGSGPVGPGTWDGSLRFGQGINDSIGKGPASKVTPAGTPLETSTIDAHGQAQQWIATSAYEVPTLGGRLKVNGRAFWNWYKENELDLITFPARSLQSNRFQNSEYQAELGARYTRPLGGRSQLELVGLRKAEGQDIVSYFRAPGIAADFTLDRKTTESILRGVVKTPLNPHLTLETGAEGALNTLISDTDYVQNLVAIKVPAANVEVRETRGETFAKAVWTPGAQVTLEAGLRAEASRITSTGDVRLTRTLTFVKPRLAATWTPVANTQVRASLEHSVGQLNFNDFVASSSLNTGLVTAGNPNLAPQQAWVSEFTLEQRFLSDGVLTLTARHSALTDAVDRAPIFVGTSVYDAPSNIGNGTKDEMIVNLSLPFDRLGVKGLLLKADSNWRRSEVTDPTTRGRREISGLAPVEWNLHLTQDIDGLSARVGFDLFGGSRQTNYRFNEVSREKYQSYVVAFAEWKPRSDILIRTEIQNVTDRQNRSTRYIHSGPRSTTPLASVDDRVQTSGISYLVRVRKSLG